jgi:Flp pilus assembly pilin Flp
MTIINNQSGAIMTEYALLVILIAVVCVAAVTLIGQSAQNFFTSVLPGL